MAANDYVFIGDGGIDRAQLSGFVECRAARAALDLLNRESARAIADRSPAAFAKLRDAYLKVFPDLPEEHKKRISSATSPDQLADLFYWILDHGKRVELRVRTSFRGEDKDDDEARQNRSNSGPRSAIAASPSKRARPTLCMPMTTRRPTSSPPASCTRTKRLYRCGRRLGVPVLL